MFHLSFIHKLYKIHQIKDHTKNGLINYLNKSYVLHIIHIYIRSASKVADVCTKI